MVTITEAFSPPDCGSLPVGRCSTSSANACPSCTAHGTGFPSGSSQPPASEPFVLRCWRRGAANACTALVSISACAVGSLNHPLVVPSPLSRVPNRLVCRACRSSSSSF